MSVVKNFRNDDTLAKMFKNKVETEVKTYNNGKEDAQIIITLDPDEETHSCNSRDSFGATFVAAASAIAEDKFKNKGKSAIVFNKNAEDKNPEFVAALTSEYDEEGENYFYNFTYDPEDISGIENVVDFRDFVSKDALLFSNLFDNHYLRSHSIAIMDKSIIEKFVIIVFECIRDYLDTYAVEGDIVEIIIDDTTTPWTPCTKDEYNASLSPVAIASVEVIKGIKKFSIQFGEKTKAIAKGNGDNNA